MLKESQHEIRSSDTQAGACGALLHSVNAQCSAGYCETNSGTGTSLNSVLVTPPNRASLSLGLL